MKIPAAALSCALCAGMAGAQNVTFSFASDTYSSFRTFRGFANDPHFDNGRVATDLVVDDANGPLPSLTLDSSFYYNFKLETIGSFDLGNGLFLHTYGISGTFRISAPETLFATIEDGVLTSIGSALAWGTTATIQASSDAGSEVTYEWTGADQPAYNLFNDAVSNEMTDAAFTLTNLAHFDANDNRIAGVPISPGSGLPAFDWESEGSFSGSAFFIPAPATASFVLACGVLASRRRR